MAERRGAPPNGGGGWLKAARDYGSARQKSRKELPWNETYPNDYVIMYQKFIINQDGVLKFGRVYLHKDLLQPGEQCVFGGGLWKIDEGRRAILLYGRSFDFGPPYLEDVRRIDWSGVGGRPLPLFFLPHWPSEDVLEPVYARR